MGKIVKYCTVCEEGFAEKFSFCPNCAASLSAFEMKPVGTEEQAKITEPLMADEPVTTAVHNFEATESVPVMANVAASFEEEIEPTRPSFLIDDDAELLDLDSDVQEIEVEPATVAFDQVPVIPAATIESFNPAYRHLNF